MTDREIRTLRDKIGTDPILTDEEIEYIWTAMDKQEVERPIRERMKDGSKWYRCQVCGQVWHDRQNYCHYCGQKTMEDQMSELRLCPNCYGEAHILPEGDYHEVTCEGCGICVQGHTYEDALNAWNYGYELYENTED